MVDWVENMYDTNPQGLDPDPRKPFKMELVGRSHKMISAGEEHRTHFSSKGFYWIYKMFVFKRIKYICQVSLNTQITSSSPGTNTRLVVSGGDLQIFTPEFHTE